MWSFMALWILKEQVKLIRPNIWHWDKYPSLESLGLLSSTIREVPAFTLAWSKAGVQAL